MDEQDDLDQHDDGPPYGRAEAIDVSALNTALCGLRLLGGDPFLRMQAFNLAIVDPFLTNLEAQVLEKLVAEERTPVPEAAFLSAQSQMWLFAVYELLRTWRQRAGEMIKWAENGGLEQKREALEKDDGYQHFGRQFRAGQIKEVLDDPGITDAIRRDLKRTHILFVQLEAIRISLAKHEVWKKGNSVALRPGYGRINMWCGALDYELENGQYSMGSVNRRDIAEGIRALLTSDSVPSDEEIASFEEFLRGPRGTPFDDKPRSGD
ncbi:MAG: hypothetical protein NXH88_03385 [Hyphomonas sp.]|nr:hypothetical protein [Hyphomonas sp.]